MGGSVLDVMKCLGVRWMCELLKYMKLLVLMLIVLIDMCVLFELIWLKLYSFSSVVCSVDVLY